MESERMSIETWMQLRRQAESRLPLESTLYSGSQTPPSREQQILELELQIQNRELCAARRELEEMLVHYRELFDCAPVGYVHTDDEHCIVDVNQMACAMFGQSADKLLGSRLPALVERADMEKLQAHLRTLKQGSTPGCEVRLPAAFGAVLKLHIESTRGLLRNSKLGCRSVLIDVTEQVQAPSIPAASARSASGTRGAVLLLIESYAPSRDALNSLLTEDGYIVRQAVSCAEAEERMKAEPDRIDAVLIETDIEDGSGLTLALCLRALRPSLPIIFLSTQALIGPVLRDVAASPSTILLVKPVNMHEVTQSLELLLKGSPERTTR